MILLDLYQETTSSIKSNKARSGLTILGIVIGIASVIAMISIGQGAQKSIETNIQSIGSNLLMVSPSFSRSAGVSAGRGSAQTLTLADAEAIKKEIANIQDVAPSTSRNFQVTAKGTNTNVSVIGTTAAYAVVRNVSVNSGSFITDQDYKVSAKSAVIGPTTAEDLFGEGVDPVGRTVRINQVDFKVVGLTASKGGSGMSNQDDIIYVPLSASQRYLSRNTYIGTISIAASSQETLTEVQNNVSDLLFKRHKIKDATSADFQIMNQADIVSTASSVTGTFTMLLAAIAGISLVVGGIGIMNMMLTNVTERTREIGLRKAIGAKANEVSRQFLAESVVLTFIGGLLGVFISWLASLIISKFANVATSISLNSILLAFGVSAIIGIIFGYYPASRAAKLNAIDALRYE